MRIRYTAVILFSLVMVFSSLGLVVPVKTQAAEPAQVVAPVVMGSTQIPGTYNPLDIALTAEYIATLNLYDSLLQLDENYSEKYLPNLATSWYVKADLKTWVFNLTDQATWYDPVANTTTPLTAEDVNWTFNWYKSAPYGTSTPGWEDYFVNVTSIRQTSTYQVELVMEFPQPRSLVENIVAACLVLPKYIWEAKPNPHTVKDFTGSGPFYFLTEITNGFKLRKNPHYWGPKEYGPSREVQIDEFWYQGYTSGSESNMITDFENGVLDILWARAPESFELAVIPWVEANPTKAFWVESPSGFVALFNGNLKPQSPGPKNTDPLLYNQTVRTAIAMVTNETALIDVLYGHATIGDTLIPPTNPWHYDYPDAQEYQFDPLAARQLLVNAGYKWQADGVTPAVFPYYPLYNETGDKLEFEFSSPNSHPEFEPMMEILIGDARRAGINLLKVFPTESVMTNKWYTGDWEVWLWDWDFSLTGDPSTGYLWLETCEGSEPPSGDNYYCDPAYDALYQASIRELNDTKRRQYTDQMQAMIYESVAYNIPYYQNRLYAVRTDRWTNWGDWAASPGLPPDMDLPWIWFRLQQPSNVPPTIISPVQPVQGFKGASVSFQTVLSDPDGDALTYNWTFGDPTPTQTLTWWVNHTYTAEGNYTVKVLVNDGHGHDVTQTTWALILDPTQRPPTGLDFVYSPPYAYATPSSVQFTSVASDADGDALYFTWNFGDGTLLYAGTATVVTHKFASPGVYDVTMYADDHHLGPGHNASWSEPVIIHVNLPPVLQGLQNVQVQPNVARSYSATATDPDPADVLRYTWNFGDSAALFVGNPVVHTYTTVGTYTYRVWVDDLTGLAGHNVSSQATVSVSTAFEPGPENLTITPSTYTPTVGVPVSFVGDADEADGDPLTFTWDFGDASALYVGNPATHTYAAPGTFTVTMYVSDGDAKDPLFHNISTTLPLTVTANQPPIVAGAADYTANVGVAVTLAISAVDPDPGDQLRYTWDFGDGSALESGVGSAFASRSHSYAPAGVYTYVVWVDDQTGYAGHNVSRSASVTVGGLNLPPNVASIVTSVGPDGTVEVDEVVSLSVAASDPNNDPLTFTWTWDDGSAPVSGTGSTYASQTHAFAATGTYTVSASVTDGVALPGHVVNRTVDITVVKAPAEGLGLLAIAGIVGVIIVAAVIAGVLLMRRRKREPGPGEPGAPL